MRPKVRILISNMQRIDAYKVAFISLKGNITNLESMHNTFKKNL